MRAYFEKVNAEDGGVCGRKLILLTEDSENSPTIALEKVRKLIEQDRVLALVGDHGTAAITGEVEYVSDPNGDGDKSDGVPHLLVYSGNPKWDDPQRWPWTIAYDAINRADGEVFARYVNDNAQRLFGKPPQEVRAAILYQNDDFGRTGRDAFKAVFAGLIATEQSYEATATDISSQLANIRAANPDVVFANSAGQFTASLFRYIATSGWRPKLIVMAFPNVPSTIAPLLGGDASLMEGALVNSFLLDAVADRDKPEMQEHARIMQRYGGGAPVSFASILGQANAEIQVEILRIACMRGDMTRKGVLEAAESLSDFHPSLFQPGITVGFSKLDHLAVEMLVPSQVQRDGSLRPVVAAPVPSRRR